MTKHGRGTVGPTARWAGGAHPNYAAGKQNNLFSRHLCRPNVQRIMRQQVHF